MQVSARTRCVDLFKCRRDTSHLTICCRKRKKADCVLDHSSNSNLVICLSYKGIKRKNSKAPCQRVNEEFDVLRKNEK